MSDQSLWGMLLVLYIVPAGMFMVWHQSEGGVADIRKKLYPGRTEILDDEKKRESNFTKFSISWSVGLGALLLAAYADWHPISAGILLLGGATLALALHFAVRYFQPFSNRLFRFWLAGSVVWILGVWSWYLVFGSHSALNSREFVLLAILPTLVAVAGIVAWVWARKP